jgi:hypothetical protein
MMGCLFPKPATPMPIDGQIPTPMIDREPQNGAQDQRTINSKLFFIENKKNSLNFSNKN